MKEITLHKELTDIGFSIIAERYQHVSQYNNCGAQLLHKGKAVIYVEDTGMGIIKYLLDKDERQAALKNPDLFLDTMIQEWISNEDDSTLSKYQWFPETIKHNYQEGQPCKVLVVGCFFGYEPIYWARYDFAPYEEIVFANPTLAQAWIEAQESSPYILKHGEAGRPEYFIIAS